MLDNAIYSKYFPISSPILKMNPTAKITCLLLFLLVPFWFKILFLLLLIYESKYPFSIYFPILKFFGIPLFVLGFLFFILFKTFFFFSLFLLIIFLFIISLTTSMSEIIYGFENVFGILKRFNFPYQSVSLYFSFAVRFLPIYLDVFLSNISSYRYKGLKCFYFKNILNSYFRTIYLIKKDLMSIKKRLYKVYNIRSNYHSNQFSVFDLRVILVLLGGILCGIL